MTYCVSYLCRKMEWSEKGTYRIRRTKAMSGLTKASIGHSLASLASLTRKRSTLWTTWSRRCVHHCLIHLLLYVVFLDLPGAKGRLAPQGPTGDCVSSEAHATDHQAHVRISLCRSRDRRTQPISRKSIIMYIPGSPGAPRSQDIHIWSATKVSDHIRAVACSLSGNFPTARYHRDSERTAAECVAEETTSAVGSNPYTADRKGRLKNKNVHGLVGIVLLRERGRGQ
jgi:hypothetical protein